MFLQDILRHVRPFADERVRDSIGKDDEIAAAPEDIVDRDRHRRVPLGKVNDVLAFLRQINACVKVSEEYIFRKANIAQIMKVEDQSEETTAPEFLSEEEAEEGQRTLYSDETESDADDD